MANFRMEEPLPATAVTRELVKSVEALIVKQIAALTKSDDDQAQLRSALKVAVSDSLGTETMSTIEEFGPSKFPDTTRSVEISFRGPWRTSLSGLEIDIQFHKNRPFSRAKVTCEGPNARELAHGIVKSLLECIAPHRSSNEWLHPRPFVSGMLFALTCASLWFASMAVGYGYPTAALLSGCLFLILATYLWILPSLRSYTTFDSRIADSRAKWFDWLMKSLLGFLLFGTLLAIARDHILNLFGAS